MELLEHLSHAAPDTLRWAIRYSQLFTRTDSELWTLLRDRVQGEEWRIFIGVCDRLLEQLHPCRRCPCPADRSMGIFKTAFTQRNIAPNCLVHVRSGIGSGGNFGDYPEELRNGPDLSAARRLVNLARAATVESHRIESQLALYMGISRHLYKKEYRIVAWIRNLAAI